MALAPGHTGAVSAMTTSLGAHRWQAELQNSTSLQAEQSLSLTWVSPSRGQIAEAHTGSSDEPESPLATIS